MPSASYQAILGMGGFFVLLGIILIVWNKREREGYYNSILLTQKDIKESLTRDPDRPWLRAWEVGGKISLIIGVMLLIIGGILWLVT
ncbi:MAG: hypothetical protein IMY79_01485 [Chloroflexi bacterium]|nr:hypothetical protein [Chloroflexota bacterium]